MVNVNVNGEDWKFSILNVVMPNDGLLGDRGGRSEERRVGKEC